MSSKGKLWILFFLSSTILIFLDQWGKHLAVAYLKAGREIQVIPNIVSLLYVENAGAAFGILHGQQWIFLGITIAVLVGILIVLHKMPINKRYLPFFMCLILIFSGAIGNCIDRQKQAYVVDFNYFRPIDFPVFNFADIYVTVACFFLLYLFFFYYKEDEFSFLKEKKE